MESLGDYVLPREEIQLRSAKAINQYPAQMSRMESVEASSSLFVSNCSDIDRQRSSPLLWRPLRNWGPGSRSLSFGRGPLDGGSWYVHW